MIEKTDKVTILTAMSTDDVVQILSKIEDDLIEISCDAAISKIKLDSVIDFVQDLMFDIDKGVNLK